MDNLTHTLFALTLARTPLARAGRGTTAALFIASNIPDVDAVSAAMGGTASYLQWHRGPTHGPLGIALLGVVSASIVWAAVRYGRRSSLAEPAASFRMLTATSMLGVLLHIGMDFPTSYGSRLLSPFDWHWYAVDWLPIVDVYLLVALGAGLAFGSLIPGARRRNAALALAVMAANYGIRGAAHDRALALAPRIFGPTLPAECASSPEMVRPVAVWPREVTSSVTDRSGERCLIELAAVPTFISPFRWRVIAHLSNAYELHEIDLLEQRFLRSEGAPGGVWRSALRVPNIWTPEVERASRARSAQVFLGFSRFPAARAFTDSSGTSTVRWNDVRFAGGRLRLDPRGGRQPFAVTVTVGPDGGVRDERIDR